MNSSQEIINKVINAGIYPQITEFMCIALFHAIEQNIITVEEDLQVRSEIIKLLEDRSCTSLAGYLLTNVTTNDASLSHIIDKFLEEKSLYLYQNWDKREELILSIEQELIDKFGSK